MSARWEVAMDDDEERERFRLPASAAQVLEALIEPGWTIDAACVSIDPELWFPEKGRAALPAVLEICASCPVRRSCLTAAIVNVEDGIWGGVQPLVRRWARAQITCGTDPLVVLDDLLDQAADIQSGRRSAA
jgi:WhiB family redox-sensing transcriptional regulator